MLVDIEMVLVGKRWRALPGRLEIRVPAPPPRRNWYRGTRVELFARLQQDRPLANPGTRRRDRLRARGIDLRGALKDWAQVRLRSPPAADLATIPGRVRDALRRAIERHHEESDLVRALLLGERTALSDAFWQTLDRSGLLHLLAISGLHVGLLIGTAQLGCRAVGLSPVWATVAGLVVAAALLVLVEPRAPVQRAAIMASAFLFARLISGRTSPTDSLAGAVVVLVTLAPLDVRELGLQLSTIATLGLLIGVGASRRRGLLASILAAAVVAQIAVAPLLALERWRVLPLAALASGTDGLLGLFRTVCAVGASLSPSVALPGVTWQLACAYWIGLAAAALSGGRLARLLGVCLVMGSVWAAMRPPGHERITLVSFDVGQGDAILLHGPQDAALYDAGGYPGLDYDIGYHVVAPQLRRLGIGRLGALAVSHAHADHAAGAPGVLHEIGAESVWVGSSPPGNPLLGALFVAARETAAITLSPHASSLQVAGCAWRVLSPAPATLLRGARRVDNGASLAFDVVCPHQRVVLAGDADSSAEHDWIANGLAVGSGPVILKVGHHGSDTSTSKELLDHLRPRHALISVAATNPWGLPRDSVVTELYRRGISVYRTDRDGAVTVTLGAAARVEAAPAARLVGIRGSNDHPLAARREPLRKVRGLATLHADRQGLSDVLGHRKHRGHGFERCPAVVLVESGNDDPVPGSRQLFAYRHETVVEELCLIDADYLCVSLDSLHKRGRVRHATTRQALLVVRNDVVLVVAIVDSRFEDLHFLARDLGSPQTPDELLALAREHAAADHLDHAEAMVRLAWFKLCHRISVIGQGLRPRPC